MNSGRIRILFLILADVFTLSASWLGTALVYHAMGGRYEMSTYTAMWPFLFVFVLLASVVRLYHGNLFYPGMALDQVEETRRMVYAVRATYLLLFCIGYVLPINELIAFICASVNCCLTFTVSLNKSFSLSASGLTNSTISSFK